LIGERLLLLDLAKSFARLAPTVAVVALRRIVEEALLAHLLGVRAGIVQGLAGAAEDREEECAGEGAEGEGNTSFHFYLA